MNLLVASKSGIKTSAGRHGIGLGTTSLHIEGIETESGVNMQPRGRMEIVRGAYNRLDTIVQFPWYDYYLALENGVDFDFDWFDYGYVVMQNAAGDAHFAWTAGVFVPTKYIQRVQKIGFDKMTWGMAVAEDIGGSDKDPHYTLTGVRRESLLAQAVAIAYGQFLPMTKSRLAK